MNIDSNSVSFYFRYFGALLLGMYIHLFIYLLVLRLWHVEVPILGTEPTLQLQPAL